MRKTLAIFFAAALLYTLLPGPSPLLNGVQGAYAQEAKPTPPGRDQAPKGKITIKGGPGDTPETALIISGAPNTQIGIAAEYHVLEKEFGQQNVDWKLKRQSVLRQKGKVYDRMELELKDGAKKDVYFDITEFFGKM